MEAPQPRDVLVVEGSDRRPVRVDRYARRAGDPPVLVLHGFKGFRRWGFFPALGQRLADEGFTALVVDFSHNGVEERDFDRLDLFLLDTYARHQEDLDAVIDSLGLDEPAVVGHSRGGTDAILLAARRPEVRAVCALAAVADTRREPPDAEEKLRSLGYYPFVNARTGQIMPVARTQFDDARLRDVPAAARALAPRPLLLVHGDADESVPSDDLETLARAHGSAETFVVEGAGHTFGARHPLTAVPAALASVFDRVADFLRRTLDR